MQTRAVTMAVLPAKGSSGTAALRFFQCTGKHKLREKSVSCESWAKRKSGWLIDSSDPKGRCVWSESDIENPLSSDV